MKKLLVMTLSLLSLSAMAGSYNCNAVITKDGKQVGKIELEKGFGMIAGRLHTVEISKKKNILGKVKEEVDVIFDGLLQSGDGSADSSIDGQISVSKLTYRGNKVTKVVVGLAKVKGSGAVEIAGSSDAGIGNGFAVEGSCEYR